MLMSAAAALGFLLLQRQRAITQQARWAAAQPQHANSAAPTVLSGGRTLPEKAPPPCAPQPP